MSHPGFLFILPDVQQNVTTITQTGRTMKLGNKTISILEAGRFRLDGGAMFGVVPRVLWEKRKQPDDKNRIAMATNLLLIQYQDRNILVDTGIGTKYDEKFKKIYAVEDDQYNLTRALEKAGLTAEAITDVILTHLHFDHTGGSTTRNAEGAVVPTFPNARYYVQKSQYEWALNPSEKDRASFFPENYVPLYEAG
ncbi:MAG TPA: MBL fold metallo-hydrolase, partial [Calditrichae bacterium]|nr:MBL fold metallo-hydrolase [Calditrichia bacterium]